MSTAGPTSSRSTQPTTTPSSRTLAAIPVIPVIPGGPGEGAWLPACRDNPLYHGVGPGLAPLGAPRAREEPDSPTPGWGPQDRQPPSQLHKLLKRCSTHEASDIPPRSTTGRLMRTCRLAPRRPGGGARSHHPGPRAPPPPWLRTRRFLELDENSDARVLDVFVEDRFSILVLPPDRRGVRVRGLRARTACLMPGRRELEAGGELECRSSPSLSPNSTER